MLTLLSVLLKQASIFMSLMWGESGVDHRKDIQGTLTFLMSRQVSGASSKPTLKLASTYAFNWSKEVSVVEKKDGGIRSTRKNARLLPKGKDPSSPMLLRSGERKPKISLNPTLSTLRVLEWRSIS
jgi:hypothetical protein